MSCRLATRIEHEPTEGTRPAVVRVRGGMEAGRQVRAAAAAELERTQDVKF